MPAPYPWWFADKVIRKWYWEHISKTKIAEELDISRTTVTEMTGRWARGEQAHRPTQKEKRKKTWNEGSQIGLNETQHLTQIIDGGQELYLDEIVQTMKDSGVALVNEHVVFRALNEMGYSRKKVRWL